MSAPIRPIKRYIELFGGANDGQIVSFPAEKPVPFKHTADNGDEYQLRMSVHGNLPMGTASVFQWFELCQTKNNPHQ